MAASKPRPKRPASEPATSGDVAADRPAPTAALVEALDLADQAFSREHDCADALEWVCLAAKCGLALPPNIGAWLAVAIHKALNEGGSLDRELGLRGTGKANLKVARRAAAKQQAALARMFELHMLGATIDQAAALVAALGDYKHSTLAGRYGRSGMGREAQSDRARAWDSWDAEKLHAMLAQYPDSSADRADLNDIKAAILSMYWNRQG